MKSYAWSRDKVYKEGLGSLGRHNALLRAATPVCALPESCMIPAFLTCRLDIAAGTDLVGLALKLKGGIQDLALEHAAPYGLTS